MVTQGSPIAQGSVPNPSAWRQLQQTTAPIVIGVPDGFPHGGLISSEIPSPSDVRIMYAHCNSSSLQAWGQLVGHKVATMLVRNSGTVSKL